MCVVDWGLVTGIATAVIAFLALLLSAYSLFTQRAHDRISVAPMGQINAGDYEGHIYVRVFNNGLGPLVVKSMKLLQNGGDAKAASLVQLMPPTPPDLAWETFTELPGQTVISAGTSRTLLSLRYDLNAPDQKAYANQIRKVLGCITIKVEYSDLYGENTKTVERLLNWFLRRFPSE